MPNTELIREQVSLADLTWWKVGGKAQYFAQPGNIDSLRQALLWARDRQLSITPLGGGSNVLISDKGIKGLVLSFRQFSQLSYFTEAGYLYIDCLAGTPKAEVTKIFLQHRLAPAHFLCGLPGDVGGGIVMNAGVSEQIEPREFNEIVKSIRVIKHEEFEMPEKTYQHQDIQWSYRRSDSWQPGLVIGAQLAWPLDEVPDIMSKVKAATKQRLAKQPLNQPSCGSVFKNPDGYKAGALIEQAGLKGLRLGGAQVSEKHANFIVNLGEARAEDIANLIEHIKLTVKERFGVQMETEVKKLGEWSCQ